MTVNYETIMKNWCRQATKKPTGYGRLWAVGFQRIIAVNAFFQLLQVQQTLPAFY